MGRCKDSKERVVSSNNKSSAIVLITQESTFETNGNTTKDPHFIHLRHPKTGEKSMYLLSDDDRCIQEVVTFDEGHRSWFIGDSVQSDGKLHIATSIDPVFLILPYLIRACSNNPEQRLYKQLECIIDDDEFPDSRHLIGCQLDDLHLVTEVKGTEDYHVYRYDEKKTLDWLRLKVDRLAAGLADNQVSVSNSAMVATFVRSTKYSDATQDDYTRYACELVSEYLPTDLAKKLTTHLGIATNDANISSEEEPPVKRSRLDNVVCSPTEDYSNLAVKPLSKKADKKTAAQKQLSKVDTQGMKTMSSFFTAKSSVKK